MILRFYKELPLLLGLFLCLIFPTIILFIVFIIEKIYIGLIICLVSLALYICTIFLMKAFTKIIIDKHEIREVYRNKIVQTFKWQDVVSVDKGPDPYLGYVSFIFVDKNGEKIFLSATKRRANKIVSVCPREDIKAQFSEFKFIVDYFKKSGKK